jgi:PAS domain S-box-containing protein
MDKELKILMLEDDVRDAELIKEELRKGGFSFRARRVETQKAFNDILNLDPPDLVLSDHGLPDFNGFEALAVAQLRCPDVPFIFITGLTGNEKEMETLERESIHYVLKSRLSRLVPVVEQATRQAGKRREHREREQALLQGEEYFRALVDGVRDYAICRLDGEGRVSSWNAGAERINGYQADEIIGQYFSRFFPDAAVANSLPVRALAQAIAQGHFQEETVLLRKGGMSFWADVVITPLKDVPEKLRGFALVVRDITTRKELEAQRAREMKELQFMLNSVKILSGLMPICASCKKIRDYHGQWHSLEAYLQAHSEATLVHEFCAECATNIQSASAGP